MRESYLYKFKRKKCKNDIKRIWCHYNIFVNIRLYMKIELGRHLVVECHVYSWRLKEFPLPRGQIWHSTNNLSQVLLYGSVLHIYTMEESKKNDVFTPVCGTFDTNHVAKSKITRETRNILQKHITDAHWSITENVRHVKRLKKDASHASNAINKVNEYNQPGMRAFYAIDARQ